MLILKQIFLRTITITAQLTVATPLLGVPELVGDDAASAVSSIHSAQSSAARV